MATTDNFQPILALDSSTEYLSVALKAAGRLTTRKKKVANRHSDFILPFVASLLKDAGVAVGALRAILYTSGPGSFTGLRIGLSVAKGLALPYHIPLIAIPSLDNLAFGLSSRYTEKNLPVTAFLDARMGEVFYARYQLNPFRRLGDYAIAKVADLTPAFYAEFPSLWCGNIFFDTKQNFPAPKTIAAIPEAGALIHMAELSFYTEVAAGEASLLYLRNKVALTEKERLHER